MPTNPSATGPHASPRPWLAAYPPQIDPSPQIAHSSIVAAWRARVASNPGGAAVRYFDGSLSAAELDAHASALAVEFQHRGIRAGDRVGVYLQNVPHYPLCLLAIWMAGAIAVPLNPMYRGHELRRLADDAEISGIVATRGSVANVRDALAGGTVGWLLSASPRDFQARDDPRMFGGAEDPLASPDGDLRAILAGRAGQRPEPVVTSLDDPAFLTYTSGTTGPPKGAINTHRNYLHSVLNYSRWLPIQPGDVVFAIAPLFHITGLSLNAGIALLNDATLSMSGRFEPSVVLDAFQEHGVTTTVGSITAFSAFFRVPSAGREHFATARLLYSGGAPIPPATIEAFRSRFGVYLHNIWGMTETTGGGIAVPPGATAPVDARSGSLSVGVPMQNADVWVIDATGAQQPPGVEGELVFRAPQVVPGYWRNPEATAHTLPGGDLRTGDVAVMDSDGWIYLVDRIKDQINTSGFKVWPREVEDVLYEHPAVFEAAVVGLPDEYRGEMVAAYVSLREGASASEKELSEFARQRLAAYKSPRRVVILPTLHKTATGKIQRAVLRQQGLSAACADKAGTRHGGGDGESGNVLRDRPVVAVGDLIRSPLGQCRVRGDPSADLMRATSVVGNVGVGPAIQFLERAAGDQVQERAIPGGAQRAAAARPRGERDPLGNGTGVLALSLFLRKRAARDEALGDRWRRGLQAWYGRVMRQPARADQQDPLVTTGKELADGATELACPRQWPQRGCGRVDEDRDH